MTKVFQWLFITVIAILASGACGQPEPIAVSVPPPIDLVATRIPGAAPLLFDGENIWVTKDGAVSKLRASDGKGLGTFTLGFTPAALAFDGEYIWVYGSSIAKLRASDGEVLGTFKVGKIGPESGSFGGRSGLLYDGQHFWVAYSIAHRLVQVRASDGEVLRTLRFDARPEAVASERDTMLSLDLSPRAMAFDGEHIWVASSSGRDHTLAKLRASDGTVIQTIPFDGFPTALAFDGEHVWVANGSEQTVVKIKASDGSRVESYFPGGLDVSFAAGSIWVATRDSTNITIFKYDSAGTVSATYRIPHPSNSFIAGEVIKDFAFDGESLWIVPADTGHVIKAKIPPIPDG